MNFITPFIEPGIGLLLKRCLRAARGKLRKHKYEQLVSAMITELLKEYPDLSAAEAKLLAARATGVEPDMHLLRAESMLSSARHFAGKKRKSAAARARWAKRKHSKKKTKSPRRSVKSRTKSKRKASK